jgi:DNA (cytosine-5)-methyltransferase 1
MTCIGQVENNPFCQKVLKKHWPNVKLIGDIYDVTERDFGAVDLVCGGFPCQPFSTAGKRKGKADDRYLWPEMLRVIEVYRPAWVLGENVAGIIGVELDKVYTDLESADYDFPRDLEEKPICFCIPACAVNAPHRRDRVWIVAWDTKSGTKRKITKNAPNTRHTKLSGSNEIEERQQCGTGGVPRSEFTSRNSHVANSDKQGLSGTLCGEFGSISSQIESSERGKFGGTFTENEQWLEPWPEVAARLCRMDDGLSGRVDRLKALGNAVVPQVIEIIGRAIIETQKRTTQ